MIKAIIFDFDGVILESAKIKTEAFKQVVSNYPKSIAKEFVDYHMTHMGISRNVKFRYFIENILNENYTYNKEKDLADKFAKIVYNSVLNCEFVPGAKEFLEKYYTTIDLFIATGTPTDEIFEIVEKRELKHFFKGIYGTPSSKDELAKQIINKYGYAINEVIFVGDANTDYCAAKSNGISFVGRLTEENREVFKDIKIKINDLFDLDKYVERINI